MLLFCLRGPNSPLFRLSIATRPRVRGEGLVREVNFEVGLSGAARYRNTCAKTEFQNVTNTLAINVRAAREFG